jgi:hypothetical protein
MPWFEYHELYDLILKKILKKNNDKIDGISQKEIDTIVKSKFKIFEVKHFREINDDPNIFIGVTLYKVPVYFLLE